MTDRKNRIKKFSNRVNWEDPLLASLLKKTESWQLDNRGTFAPLEVEIQLGWGAGSFRPGTVVWQKDQVSVLETTFPIEPGVLVRIDRRVGDSLLTTLGTVLESRPGSRAHEQPGDVYVHWVIVR